MPPTGFLHAIISASLIIILLNPGLQAAAQDGPQADSTLYPSPTDRFGFGFVQQSGQDITDYDVAQLRAGWYVNWGSPSTNPNPAGLEFVPIIRLCDPSERPGACTSLRYRPAGEQLDRLLLAHPGSLWLVGNEPDAPLQDAIRPENYVELYHQVYHHIKAVDPTARVAIGGIVQATPLRMRWINKVWYGYKERFGKEMPVDVWNIHTFVLREVRQGKGMQCRPPGATDSGDWGAQIPPGVDADCGQWVHVDELDRMDLFEEQIIRFRTWMRDHGQRDKELIVSEYGILFPEELGYGHKRVRDYMYATFDYFLNARDPQLGMPEDGNRLVQRWAWYSLNDTSFEWGTTWSALFNSETREIMPLGKDFASYTEPLFAPYHDLAVASVGLGPNTRAVYGQMSQLELQVVARNWGNTATPPTLLRWWRETNTDTLQEITQRMLPPVPIRWGGEVTSSVTWQTLINGPTHVKVQLNADERVEEPTTDNNWGALAIDVNLKAGEVTHTPDVPTTVPDNPATITLQAQVHNTGDVEIAQHQVGFWSDHPEYGEYLDAITVSNLGPDETATVELTVHLEIGMYLIHVHVDFPNTIQESSQEDNLAVHTIHVLPDRALLTNRQHLPFISIP